MLWLGRADDGLKSRKIVQPGVVVRLIKISPCLQIVREEITLQHEDLRREMSKISSKKNSACVTFYCIGALVYNKNFDRFTDLVGVTNQVDWELTDQIKENELKAIVNMSGKLMTRLAAWLFRSKKKTKKNPTFFYRIID